MMYPGLLDRIVTRWQDVDNDHTIAANTVDLMALVSYCTMPEKLTRATACITLKGIEWWRSLYPSPVVAISCCSYPFPGSADIEYEYRKAKLDQAGVDRVIRARDMENSFQEAEAIHDAATDSEQNLNPRCILVVTGQMHTLFGCAREIWRWAFPHARILITCIPWKYEFQPDHPVKMQQTGWRWLRANLERRTGMYILGPDMLKQYHHKAVRPA